MIVAVDSQVVHVIELVHVAQAKGHGMHKLAGAY